MKIVFRQLVLFLLLPVLATAQNSVPTPTAENATRAENALSRSISLGKLAAPPQIDGVLSDGEWEGAAQVSLGFQVEPGDNLSASERTAVWVASDHQYLYLAFHAFDHEPTAIRARVVKRDDLVQEDFVSVYLDTYNDRQRAYRFTFNPLGIQEDAIYIDNGNTTEPDVTWDGILESKGKVTDDGYVVEVAIPFKTMRFRAGREAQWGLQFRRRIARKAEVISWLPHSRDKSGLLQQTGTLTGLEEVYSGRTLDLIPTIVGSINTQREFARLLPEGIRKHTINKLSPGLTAIYSLTPNLTLSATINPDFSQIESDVPQADVNQRFDLYYPERRPFFLEGTEIFNPLSEDNIRLLNTREIVAPEWGLKLTGKIGRNSIGFLTAADRAPGLLVDYADPNFGQNAQFTIARVQRDWREDSTIGGWVLDRRFGNSANTVIAADSRLRVNEVANLFVNVIRTRTREESGETNVGYTTEVRYTQLGRNWRVYAGDRSVSPNYRNDAGFIDRINYHEQRGDVGYVWRPKPDSKLNRWLVYAYPYAEVNYSRYITDGKPEVQYAYPAFEMQFQRGILLTCYPAFYREGFAGKTLNYHYNSCTHTIGALKRISFKGEYRFGQAINYDSANTVLGKQTYIIEEMVIRPSDKLSLGWLYLKSSLHEQQTGGRFFNQEILRNRTTYQFSQAHSVRAILDYDTALRRFGSSLLYAWAPRPNTALYLGWNNLLFNGYDPLREQRTQGLFQQQRSFFVKLSWNFRM